MPRFDPFEIPGYREAISKEREARDLVFLGVGQSLCGLEVNPLTPIALLRLDAVENAFAVGVEPSAVDVAQFIWCVSPEYNPKARFKRWSTVRKLRRVKLEDACREIDEYLKLSFMDAPARTNQAASSYTSWIASLVHRMASSYGWSQQQVLDCPFRALWQYIAHIRRDENPDLVGFNPSQAIVNRHFAEINRKAKEARQN